MKKLIASVAVLPFLFGGISEAVADQACAEIAVYNTTNTPFSTHASLQDGTWDNKGGWGWPGGPGWVSNPDGSPPSTLPPRSKTLFRTCSNGGFLATSGTSGTLEITGVGGDCLADANHRCMGWLYWNSPWDFANGFGGWCDSSIDQQNIKSPFTLKGGAESAGGNPWTCMFSFDVSPSKPVAAPVTVKDLTLDASTARPSARATYLSPVTGYFQASDQSRHIFFVDGSGHIHEMYLSVAATHWVEHDLTATARPPDIAAMPESPLAAYLQSSNNSQHVNFIDGQGHVRELRYDAKYKYWSNFDLTLIGCSARTAAAVTNAITAAAIINPGPGCNSVSATLPGSALAAYWQANDDSQHVDFIAKASNGSAHVHELFQTPNQSWLDTDLTSQANVNCTPIGCLTLPAVLPNALHGYWVGSNNSQHVNFIDASGDVHELYSDGNSWSDNDLTALARSRYRASRATALTGYWERTDDSQHVNFVSDDGHIHELFIHPGHQLLDNDLTVKSNKITSTGALGGVIPEALIGYWEQADNSQHLYAIAADSHVHHLHWDGSRWAGEDLTYFAANCTQSSQPSPVSGVLSAYKSPDDGYEAVTFIGKPNSARSNVNPRIVDVFQYYTRPSGSQCP